MYREGLYNIGRLYANQYSGSEKGREVMKSVVVNCYSIRLVLIEIYKIMVKRGECEDITKLSIEEKRELYNEAKEWSKSEDRDILVEVCKSIIVIGSLIK